MRNKIYNENQTEINNQNYTEHEIEIMRYERIYGQFKFLDSELINIIFEILELKFDPLCKKTLYSTFSKDTISQMQIELIAKFILNEKLYSVE